MSSPELHIKKGKSGIARRSVIILLCFAIFMVGGICPGPGLTEDEPSTPTKVVLPEPRKKESNQVRIRMKVLEWSIDESMEYGFRVFYTPVEDSSAIIDEADLTFPMSSGTDSGMRIFLDNLMSGTGSFEAVIECLEQYGEVEVLSEPNIICPVMENLDAKNPYYAKVGTGSKIPFEKAKPVGETLAQVTDFREVGVNLNVGVKKIIDNQYIQVHTRIDVKNLAGYISVGTNQAGNPLRVPQLTSRQITNILLAENEKTLIAGLLLSESKSSTGLGVPWISKIPLIGNFFQSKKMSNKRQELVFLLRPEIIYD